MKKTVDELVEIVKDILPESKGSERLFIVDLILTERHESYIEGMNRTLEIEEEERQSDKEEKEHYSDYSDQPDYSSIKEDYDSREEV